jgi:hypothetical protein
LISCCRQKSITSSRLFASARTEIMVIEILYQRSTRFVYGVRTRISGSHKDLINLRTLFQLPC